MRLHRVRVSPVPAWVDAARLLGRGDWTQGPGSVGLCYEGMLEREAAADVGARLRGLHLGGRSLEVEIVPKLDRKYVRRARLEDARRRRDTTPGFERPGARMDSEGHRSLTPEALALWLGQQAAGVSVVDACCGVGGNAIGFARAGCQVIAIDLDPGRLDCARHNARLYGVTDRIEFRVGNAVELVSQLEADLLFVDPPWGEDWNRPGLGVAELPPLGELISQRGRFSQFWSKLPPSCEARALQPARLQAVFGCAPGDRQRIKFVLARLG